MKKKLFHLTLLLLILSCQKEGNFFNETTKNLHEISLPTQFLGTWQWIGSWGGGWTCVKPTLNEKNVLTIQSDKTYKWCKNDTCSTGKLFFGSRASDNGKYVDTLIVFEPQKIVNNSPLVGIILASKPIIWRDTLTLSAQCNDCNSLYFKRN